MELTKPQKQIAEDTHRFRVLRAGRRFGKTFLAVEEIKGKAISRNARIAYFATTYQQARDIIWNLLLKELSGCIQKVNESRLEIVTHNLELGSSVIQLKGWESVETTRGQAFNFIVLDEVATMRNFWTAWNDILRPTLTDTQGEAMFISTPKGFNHFYDLCNKELLEPEFKSFHFTSYDNPHINREELESAKKTLPRESFEQEYMASFQKMQGLVYKEFNRQKHLYEILPDIPLRKIAGVDFGFQNPCAVLHIYTDGERYYVHDEFYKRERTDDQIAEYVAACNFSEVYPDPESPTAIEQLRRANVNVREVIKGKDSVRAGIQKVRELFLAGKIKINRQCINLISELEMYAYEDATDKNHTEKPIKANDHALDALRYVIMMANSTKSNLSFRENIHINFINSTK